MSNFASAGTQTWSSSLKKGSKTRPGSACGPVCRLPAPVLFPFAACAELSLAQLQAPGLGSWGDPDVPWKAGASQHAAHSQLWLQPFSQTRTLIVFYPTLLHNNDGRQKSPTMSSIQWELARGV